MRRPPKRTSSATVMFHATLGYFCNDKIPGMFLEFRRVSMNVKSRRFHPLARTVLSPNFAQKREASHRCLIKAPEK